jgi:hypothetical protein
VLDTGQLMAGSAKRAGHRKTYTFTITHTTGSVERFFQTSQAFVSHATEQSMRFTGGIDERA